MPQALILSEHLKPSRSRSLLSDPLKFNLQLQYFLSLAQWLDIPQNVCIFPTWHPQLYCFDSRSHLILSKAACIKQYVLEIFLFMRANGFKSHKISAQRMNTHTHTHTHTHTRTHTHTLILTLTLTLTVGMIGLAVCHYGCLADHMFGIVTHWLFPYTNTHTARSSICASKPSAAGYSLKLNKLLLRWLNQGEGKKGVKVRKYCLQPILLWESDYFKSETGKFTKKTLYGTWFYLKGVK